MLTGFITNINQHQPTFTNNIVLTIAYHRGPKEVRVRLLKSSPGADNLRKHELMVAEFV